MPPRYAYWTIIAGGLPTAFRAAEREELMPTFTRLREKHPDAEMRWFARGKLWDSPDAARGELDRRRMGDGDRDRQTRRRADSRAAGAPPARDRDWRPGGEHRDPRQKYADAKKARNLEQRKAKFARKHGTGTGRDAAGERERPAPDSRASTESRRERFGDRFTDRPRPPKRPGETRDRGPSGSRPRDKAPWRREEARPPRGEAPRENGERPRTRDDPRAHHDDPRTRHDEPRARQGEPRTRDKRGAASHGRGTPHRRASGDTRHDGWKPKRDDGAGRPWNKPRDAGRTPKGKWDRDAKRPSHRPWESRGDGSRGPERGDQKTNRPWEARRDDRGGRPTHGKPNRSRDAGRREDRAPQSSERRPHRPWEERGESRPRGPAAPRSGPADRGAQRPRDERDNEPGTRRFAPRTFERNQGTEEPNPPPRPRGPNREPRPSDSPEPTPPPRPTEPVTAPPGPPERGRLIKKPRR
jgi:hypothetical protein